MKRSKGLLAHIGDAELGPELSKLDQRPGAAGADRRRAAAAASGSAAGGATILGGVALGTVPALTTVALFGSTVPLNWRRVLARGAGVLLILVGIVTFARGLGMQHEGHAGNGTAPAAVHQHH